MSVIAKQLEKAPGAPNSDEQARNPPWTRDELILALELYMRNRASPPGKASVEVQELSTTLNKLGIALGFAENNKFRNANGVYMKMMNFRRFDPEYSASGKVGLTRGNKDEEEVAGVFRRQRAFG
jgi:5-methylcytosine-specific restriction enzyme A